MLLMITELQLYYERLSKYKSNNGVKSIKAYPIVRDKDPCIHAIKMIPVHKNFDYRNKFYLTLLNNVNNQCIYLRNS